MVSPLAVPCVLALASCVPWVTDVEEFADPEGEIARAVAEAGLPSLAAFVVQDDAIVWEQHYGRADIASERTADRRTIYRLASVSKLVVATAVMQLAERGLIDLHADINDYLPFGVRNPSFPDDAITPYHLLTHTSGLNWPESDAEVPGFYRRYPMDASPPLQEALPAFILPGGEQYVPAVWLPSPPGKREYYSNIGTALAAYLVEVVSGMDYNEYCKQYIFDPLGMVSTSHAYADLDMQHVATLYGDRHSPLSFYRYLAYPAGELKSTTSDFARFLLAYMNGGQYESVRILEEETVDQVLEMRNPASGLCLLWNRTLGNWYGHAGGKDGVAAYVEFQRDSKVGLMVVSNYRHPWVYPGHRIHALVRRIADRYHTPSVP